MIDTGYDWHGCTPLVSARSLYGSYARGYTSDIRVHLGGNEKQSQRKTRPYRWECMQKTDSSTLSPHVYVRAESHTIPYRTRASRKPS